MSIPYFDAHCDTLTAVLERGGSLSRNSFHVDCERLRMYGPSAQVFAVWGGRYEEKAALLRSAAVRGGDCVCAARPPRWPRRTPMD